MRRILVAHHLLLGDTIMLAPLFKKLRSRYPLAEIVTLVPVAWLPLFAGRPYGVDALAYDPRSIAGHRQLFKSGPYDWALVPADNRWSWLAKAMGARWITAFAGGPGGVKDWPVDEYVDWPEIPAAWGDIACRLVPGPLQAGFEPGEWPAPPPMVLPAGVVDYAKPYAVFHLGASSPHKLWPPERWRALADMTEQAGYRVILSTGPGETGLAKAVDPSGRLANLAGRLDLAGLWHLLAGSAFLVCPDTGVAHLARLTGTPAVVLFGPGSPVVSGAGDFWRDSRFCPVWIEDMPCRDQNLLFERPLPWVRHCWRTPSECGKPECMRRIGLDAVAAAVAAVADVNLQ